ncbi:hypothetical protein RND81_01G226700 [Saponaria officinalis]|uniref:PTC1-like winged helix-turn-helix domain-containing protein n=1 Tax=Saponaria officinalis TaxID=3572 RepID=A0AAW1N969_SAPOF
MEIEVGSVYRVNHSNCPNLTSLSTIQAVLVSKKSDEEVTVVFPSMKSLNTFFGGEKFSGSMQPSMDEEFVMGLKVGYKILTHKISFEEFAAQRGNKHFWVSSNHINKQLDDDDHKSEVGVKWETRRRTRFYTRRKLLNADQKINASNTDDHQVVDSTGVCCQDEGVNSKEDEEDNKDEDITAKPRSVGKRKCQFKGVTYRDKRKKRRPPTEEAAASQKKFIDSQHRWTVERYKLAELNMLKIMKEKGAGPNNPVLRPDLRAEARKLIGDTGLLDHLLKHMAGKLAPGGQERFCRRHNPEGAMEYWMESADLVHVRKREGIEDPFWVPPPGWKPGDCPTHDPLCALQLKELREEIWSMKREIENLSSRRRQEKSEALMEDPTKPEKAAGRLNFEESLNPLREMYEEVMKKKAKVEKQLLDICRSFSGMEEEMERLKEAAASSGAVSQNAEIQTRAMSAAATAAGGMKEGGKEGTEEQKKSGERGKSGFRMCRPEGTFLWPSQQRGSSHEQLLLMAPPHDGTTHQQSHRVARPEATRAGVTLSFSTASVGGSTIIHSIDRPTTTTYSSSRLHYFVPDLNQAPFYSSRPAIGH